MQIEMSLKDDNGKIRKSAIFPFQRDDEDMASDAFDAALILINEVKKAADDRRPFTDPERIYHGNGKEKHTKKVSNRRTHPGYSGPG